MDAPRETVKSKTAMNALDALRWDWGKAYEIDGADDEWRARRRDGLGGWMEAGSAEDLRNQILSDYLMKPVPEQPRET
jgi:hypothetical protein